jgi:hypothetical protein
MLSASVRSMASVDGLPLVWHLMIYQYAPLEQPSPAAAVDLGGENPAVASASHPGIPASKHNTVLRRVEITDSVP